MIKVDYFVGPVIELPWLGQLREFNGTMDRHIYPAWRLPDVYERLRAYEIRLYGSTNVESTPDTQDEVAELSWEMLSDLDGGKWQGLFCELGLDMSDSLKRPKNWTDAGHEWGKIYPSGTVFDFSGTCDADVEAFRTRYAEFFASVEANTGIKLAVKQVARPFNTRRVLV
jgi:hypothetical protein